MHQIYMILAVSIVEMCIMLRYYKINIY